MSNQIEFTRPDGAVAPGFYAEPEGGAKAPGIVVIQEWWGLNDQIKRIGKDWTDAGYRVLIPDLYRGEKALDEKEAEHKMDDLDFEDAATQDVRGAVQYLKADSDKVGVIGFCMGGVLAVLAAMHVPETDVAVSWYGIPPDEAGDPKTIDVPLQCHFATQDTFFPIESADAFEAELKAGSVEYEAYRYDARHAFANEDWDNYDAQASKQAWERSMAFFEKYLKG
ncbi:MAG: dienelactone hydrolase family protein [Salinisphaera sp.]|jgi:carboxymethylenebutenolidase|nr:dienelactone hydrolase family protein [Salinisphaera sp.]